MDFGFDGETLLSSTPRLVPVEANRALAPRIQACLDGAPEYFLLTDGRRAPPDAALELVAEAEADHQRRVYALLPRAGGSVVGVLDLYLHYPEPGVAHVGLLLFRSSCQGLGYGRELMAALEAGLARGGFDEIRLSVTDENAEARAFWERLGFAGAGRLDGGVTVYEKPLAGDSSVSGA